MMKHVLVQRILEILSEGEPLKAYQIRQILTKKFESVAYDSSVHTALKSLTSKGLLRIYETEKWRTGLSSSKYFLSIKGLIEYFSMAKDNNQLTKVIENYSNHYPYPIFKKWHAIVEMFGKEETLNAFHISVNRVKTREFSAIYSRLNPYVKTRLAWMRDDDFIMHTLTCFLFARLSFTRFETSDGKPLKIGDMTKDVELLKTIEDTIRTELRILGTEKEVITDVAKIYGVSV